jgi:hypothetical protein
MAIPTMIQEWSGVAGKFSSGELRHGRVSVPDISGKGEWVQWPKGEFDPRSGVVIQPVGNTAWLRSR